MNSTLEEEKIQQRGKRKRRKVLKGILMTVGVIIVALAAFVITVKLCKPDFDFTVLIPQSAVSFIKEDVLKQTEPQTEAQTVSQTKKETTVDYADYLPFSEFEFDTSKQGSQVGNILNKTNGAVTFNASYIYFSVKGSGIYRFTPSEETTSKLKGSADNSSSLNIMEDFLYYVDDSNHTLKKVSVSGGDAKTIAKDIKQAYGYNGELFCITTANALVLVSADGSAQTTLYSAGADKELGFVGISLNRAYFTIYDQYENEVLYVTVDKTGSDRQYFREPTKKGEITSMQLENGFFYYYEMTEEGSYNLVRKKFGSEKEVTLLKDVSNTDYPVIYANRLYYTDFDKGSCYAMELNMNSDKKKKMLSVSDADKSGTLAVGCGYQYIFLIGTKTDSGEKVYRSSCIYTSASADNMMDFKNGKWKF